MGTFDISRINFNAAKHYSSVRMQQGRVLTDDDWNENERIEDEELRRSRVDIIGPYGTPDEGFLIKDPPRIEAGLINFDILPGTIHLGGLRLELESPETYRTQKDWLQQPALLNQTPDFKNKVRYDLVYIEAWQQAVSAVEDSSLFEVALGGPDTTTRLRTMRRIHLATGVDFDNCIDAWDQIKLKWKNHKLGKINEEYERITDTKLKVSFSKTGLPDDLCTPSAIGGYLGAENQAIRIQLVDKDHFTWGFDNASPIYRITIGVNGKTVTMLTEPKDQYHWPLTGQVIEILPWSAVLPNGEKVASETGHLSKVEASYDPDKREFTLKDAVDLAFGMDWKSRADKDDLDNQIPSEYFYMRVWHRGADLVSEPKVPVTTNVPVILGHTGLEITISGDDRVSGDFWVIAARPETPNRIVPWEAEIGIEHNGVRRYFAPLAILEWSLSANESAVGKVIDDCRIPFLPLTELQSAEDLRLHHKYLHGYGVVCGLKVKCGLGRNGVIIETGVALDCEGYMIRSKKPITYNLVETAISRKLIDGKGFGRICLTISRGKNKIPVISMEPFVLESFWDRVLEGTLLKDFWDDCIKSLIDLFTTNFPTSLNGAEEVPVSRKQRRLTAFINLFAQKINPQSGSFAFISGNSPKREVLGDGSDEDDLLREFYHMLRDKMESETYCGIYDGDRPFPDYNIERGLDTVFGPPVKMHQKLKMHPEGKFAYTCGTNNKIYVYALAESQELIDVSTFPVVATNIRMQDIAVEVSGEILYSVGIENNNSWFAEAKIDQGTGKLTWGTASVINNVKYVSLGMDDEKKSLFAIAKSRGLFEIKGIGTAAFGITMIEEFNATGLLHINQIHERWTAVAAAVKGTAIGTESATFDHFLIIDLRGTSVTGSSEIVAGGSDAAHDILIHDQFIYASSDDSGQRMLCKYNFQGRSVTNRVILDDDSYIRMAVFRNILLLTLSDECKVIRIDLNNEEGLTIDDSFRIPTQILPIDIVVDDKSKSAYVLNSLVNTITTINLTEAFHTQPRPGYTQEPPVDLAEYRSGVYNAYFDLLSHLVQSLKDCFCDKFLIDCPDCDEEDKIYLGCVDIQDFKVHHICNFTKRKYVKSFRTVEYWLSTVPVLPIVNEAFSKFCCMVVERPDKMGTLTHK